jgi:hypothetical protein
MIHSEIRDTDGFSLSLFECISYKKKEKKAGGGGGNRITISARITKSWRWTFSGVYQVLCMPQFVSWSQRWDRARELDPNNPVWDRLPSLWSRSYRVHNHVRVPSLWSWGKLNGDLSHYGDYYQYGCIMLASLCSKFVDTKRTTKKKKTEIQFFRKEDIPITYYLSQGCLVFVQTSRVEMGVPRGQRCVAWVRSIAGFVQAEPDHRHPMT